ncbi:CGNR zinc finger domain-containing protein [Streptomyces violens]|uniref:CGNR zinc finger domain-containing protein n=1 Tax=Streptomyces violens TaxID=66377 RepID=UPI0004C0A7A0|nr:ABATE domain-containing protein [Streptomyces violens]
MSDLFPLTGEPLALDLINTQPATGELLRTPEDLRTWWALQADRLPEGVPANLKPADLAAVLTVREHVARVLERVRTGQAPAATDITGLNDAQRAAPVTCELSWRDGKLVAQRRRDGRPGVRLAAWLAEAAVELLADPTAQKIRVCEADDCVLLFLPQHPRRRWCSAARCGNRARVARHYQRHKAG